MRWMAMVVVMVGCSLPEVADVPEAPDAGLVVDAGPPFDPCAWDGWPGYCYGVTGYVSQGGACTTVCAPGGNTNGKVFRTRDECALTCSCRPAKFTSPIAIGAPCDAAWFFDEVKAQRAEEGCELVDGGLRCRLDNVTGGPLDQHGMAAICHVSAWSTVRAVWCENRSD